MRYERFEDLPVWQAAADLAARIILWTGHPWFRGKGDLGNQIQRASLSISNNISEGFERGTTNELLHFLYISRGSAGEVRSMLAVMERMEVIAKAAVARNLSGSEFGDPQPQDFKSQISDFKGQCENISRQLYGWANSLQNSEVDGQRHQNDKTRQDYDQRQRREAFQKKLDVADQEAQNNREEQRRQLEEQRRVQPGKMDEDSEKVSGGRMGGGGMGGGERNYGT